MIAIAEPGASPAGLRMTEHPAANPAANFLAGRSAGKFHAEKAATTPTGSNLTFIRISGSLASIDWP